MLPPELRFQANQMVQCGDAVDFADACRKIARRRHKRSRRAAQRAKPDRRPPAAAPKGGYWWNQD